jgi:hypothetical protein
MRLIDWLGVAAILAMLLLPRAEGADDKRAIGLESETKALKDKIASLDARLKELERMVQASGGGLKLVSPGGLTIQGGGSVVIQGGGGVDIRGATIKLNGGGKPIARLGDPVVVQAGTGGGAGQITSGSPTVTVP